MLRDVPIIRLRYSTDIKVDLAIFCAFVGTVDTSNLQSSVPSSLGLTDDSRMSGSTKVWTMIHAHDCRFLYECIFNILHILHFSIERIEESI